MLEIAISRQRLEVAKQSLEEMVNGRKFQIMDKLAGAGQRKNNANSSGAERSLGASLDCFGVIDLLWNRTTQAGALDRNSPAAAIFSAYIGAEYGLAELEAGNGGKTRVAGRNAFGNERIDFGRMYPLFLEDILSAYSRALENPAGVETSRLTCQFFSWIKEKAIVESERLAEFGKRVSSIKGSICEDYEFYGISSHRPRQPEEKGEFCWENFGGYKKQADYFRQLALIIEKYDYCLSLDSIRKDELLPKGILLAGPPGTGKTRLARTFCNESAVPFEMFGVSDVGSSYVYETSNNIQRKFDAAAACVKNGESKVSVLFIDELDSLGRTRSRSSGAGSEDDKVVTALNCNMDGHLAVDGVMVIGATNLPEAIDPALTRPGRFEKKIYLGAVTRDDAKDIFSKYLRGCEGIDLDQIVGRYIADSAEPGSMRGADQHKKDGRFDWNGAMIREAVSAAKRRMLLEHLNGKGLPTLTTQDLCDEIEELYVKAD